MCALSRPSVYLLRPGCAGRNAPAAIHRRGMRCTDRALSGSPTKRTACACACACRLRRPTLPHSSRQEVPLPVFFRGQLAGCAACSPDRAAIGQLPRFVQQRCARRDVKWAAGIEPRRHTKTSKARCVLRRCHVCRFPPFGSSLGSLCATRVSAWPPGRMETASDVEHVGAPACRVLRRSQRHSHSDCDIFLLTVNPSALQKKCVGGRRLSGPVTPSTALAGC